MWGEQKTESRPDYLLSTQQAPKYGLLPPEADIYRQTAAEQLWDLEKCLAVYQVLVILYL